MDRIESALEALPCEVLNHDEWVRVGMALKAEGYDVSVWDAWSSRDAARYHPGECARRWASFQGSAHPVGGGTIIALAKDYGWQPPNGCLDWNDEINDCDAPKTRQAAPSRAEKTPPAVTPEETSSASEELITYLETLFEPDDLVGYVTSAWQNKDGKWQPDRGAYDRTARELIEALRAHPDDPGAVIGDWKPEAGAWIRFNPLDGKGVRNGNVTRFRYALVESDTIPVDEQIRKYRALELPIAAMVHSGGKSVHAIVRVDADSPAEYSRRVDYLYRFLAEHGVPVDPQNRNPSRLSRMPGVTRNGCRQRLLAVRIGRKSWEDWLSFAESNDDGLPEIVSLSAYVDNPPPLPEELIRGVLRRGHKMLIAGSSKAGKSCLLMELCVAIAEGRPWLGFECRKGRVLYVNLEIDGASCIHRLYDIYDALKLDRNNVDKKIDVWNMRGHALPLNDLAPLLIRRVKEKHFDAIVIDPIYKVITGDENSATDMGFFCNCFDRISTETGCAVIYCHHHSKGAQGGKRSMDRASGSGVFARDPDALLDIIELELTDSLRCGYAAEGATAWRIESNLREFRNIKPLNFWFEYPVHRVDKEGVLAKLTAWGETPTLEQKIEKVTVNDRFREAYRQDQGNGGVSVRDMAGRLGLSERSVRERVQRLSGEFDLANGRIVQRNG